VFSLHREIALDNRAKLIEMTNQVFVVAHKEDTSPLEIALLAQGFNVHVQRGPYNAEQQRYSSQMKCLVNHANVWRRVASGNKSVIVLEADFVPVREFSTRYSPMPNDMMDKSVGFAWLYSAGSILYGFDKHYFPHGHGNTTVAYMLSPQAAKFLLYFFERETRKVIDSSYVAWETYLGIYLRKECGILNYIPIYQYGEHGGLPQPEHRQAGVRPWHQADILLGKLEFMPHYARKNLIRYFFFRARSYARGWVRVFLLRYYNPRSINSDTTLSRYQMAWFSIARLLKLV
jgi:hypothetical protein